MTHQFQPGADAERLRQSVCRRRLGEIFHYTYVSALPSILRTGAILGRNQMEARGIAYLGHGYGHAGKEEELGDYIFCGFLRPWGMMKDETDPIVVLQLNPRLIWSKGTLFCPNNSAFNQFSLSDLLSNTTVEAFDSMFPNLYTSRATNIMAEIMVFRMIPVCEIEILHFVHKDVLTEAGRICRGVSVPAQFAPASGSIKVEISSYRFPPHQRLQEGTT